MKKLIAIFLLLAYAGTAYGITISRHYCQGDAKGITIANFEKTPECCCTDASMPDDCCQDEVNKADTDDHSISQPMQFDSQPIVHLNNHSFWLIAISLFPSITTDHEQATLDKHNIPVPPLFLLNRVIRI